MTATSPSVLVHNVALNGFGKGTNELYDRARPSYPSPALSAIRAALTTPPPFNVLEIGSGTGIFTRALLAHPEFSTTIRQLIAVEPSEGMRDQFSRTLHDRRVTTIEGTFQQTHVPDQWADLIIVAQAFHWCPDYDKAMSEFSRALAPNGRVVFIWNLEDSKTPWVHQARRVIEAFELGTPQYRLGLWRQVFQTPTYIQQFQPPEEYIFHHIVQATIDSAIERAFSKSYIAFRPEEEKRRISHDLLPILERGDGMVWIHERQGIFEYPYDTTVVVMKKHLSDISA